MFIIIILKRKNKTFAFLTSQSLIEKLDLVFLIFLTDFVFCMFFSVSLVYLFFFLLELFQLSEIMWIARVLLVSLFPKFGYQSS